MIVLQGVDRVSFYIMAAHRNMHKVLKYYKEIAFVETIYISVPHEVVEDEWNNELIMQIQGHHMMNQVLHYHDCFYRQVP